MAVLADGRFLFIGENHQLYLETRDEGSFSLLFGGAIVSFAYNESLGIIALVCPKDLTFGVGTSQQQVDTTVRLYTLASDELQDLVAELETPPATQVLWVEDRFVVASNPDGVTSIMEFTGKALRLYVQDSGVFPFAALHSLGLVGRGDQRVTLWDLTKNKAVDAVSLPNRVGKRGFKRSVAATSCTGSFVWVINSDATAHGLYVAKGTVRLVSPLISDFCSASSFVGKGQEAGQPHCLAVRSLALSPTVVAVGVTGSNTIMKYQYTKSSAELRPIGKCTMKENGVLLAISKDRYLMKLEQKGKSGAGEYRACELHFTPFPEPRTTHVETEDEERTASQPTALTAEPAPTDNTDAPTKKKRRRRKKKKATLEDSHEGDLDPLEPAEAAKTERWGSHKGVALGGLICAFLVVASTFTLRAIRKRGGGGGA